MIELTRRFLKPELDKDSQVKIIKHRETIDYQLMHQAWKNISRMPYANTEKKRLREYIIHSNEISYIQIRQGYLYIYTWDNGESRYFLTTRNNTLIESFTQAYWYPCFPCIKSINDNNILFDDAQFNEVGKIRDFKWIANTKNFCHFIFDCLAPYASAEMLLRGVDINIPLLTIGPLEEWQQELINSVGMKDVVTVPAKVFSNTKMKFEIENMYLPVQTNQMLSQVTLKEALYKRRKREISDSNHKKIIFITRKDQRRRRISNIDEIEAYIIKRGGIVVDTIELTVKQKYEIFASCSVCIAEGSGCMNWALFADENSKLIHLIDPSVLEKPEFTYGGHIYFLSMVHRIRYLVGESHKEIKGSPLGSAFFNIEKLEHLIQQSTQSNIFKMDN